MSRVENLDQIIEAYGPHLHDAPHGGWRADRVIDKIVPTHCPYCAVQCGMNLLVEQNHVVGVEPRYDFPVNEGRLCPKGVTAYLQVHHPDRLLYPLIKRNGRFERASWDQALDLVVNKFRELQNTHGKDSIGVYSGSSLTTEKTYLMGKFARAGLWGMVFPFGMYTVCTFQLSKAIDFPSLLIIPKIFIYLALLGWLMALLGLVRSFFKKRTV